MKTTFRKLALALAASAALGSAQAGMLTFQDVVFTTDWTNNILTLEIDAATPGGNWNGTTGLGAIGIKDFGQFDSVSLLSAPGGTSAWKLDSNELSANGCDGGNGGNGGNGNGNGNRNGNGNGGTGGNVNSATRVLCLYGGAAPLADDMVFRFALTGLTNYTEPHLKLNFLDSSGKQTGDLMSETVLASTTVVVPPPLVVVPPVVKPTLPDVPNTNKVPEPQTIALTLAGLFLMGTVLRKRS